jgi:hypothetical protein
VDGHWWCNTVSFPSSYHDVKNQRWVLISDNTIDSYKSTAYIFSFFSSCPWDDGQTQSLVLVMHTLGVQQRLGGISSL